MLSGFSSATAAVILVGFSSGAALSDGLAARFMAISKACQADVQTFCQGLPPGGGRVMHCLGANYMSVSAACHGTMTAAMNDLCSRDLVTLCPGTSLGGGEAESCLQSHVAELTGSCKAAAGRMANK